MKQIVDKLNKIAKKIDESVEIPQTDLIIDSLDAITKAYGGTPNDSNLIVDKLEDIYNNIGPAVSGNIEITENGENINVAPYATATVNVAGGGDNTLCTITLIDTEGETLSNSLLLLNENLTAVDNTGLSYPATVYGVYDYNSRQNKYYVYSLNDFETTTSTFSNDLFTNLVNCEIESEVDGNYTYWGVHVLDNTKPSSLTINTLAFHIESN